MAKKNVEYTTTPLESVRHIKEERINIPTEELRDFLPDEEKNSIHQLYPRDSSLDPQLVWKGKDQQDAADLSVPIVPLYIQEQIQPQALIETLRQETGSDKEQPLNLFADFNGISFEDKVDFYHHAHQWTNRMILGDSLLAMNSLAEKENMKGKVQMIYIDPPYGIKFGSNWQVSTRKREVKDSKADDATRQPEQIKAFRDTWELGIHSYLSYLRDRLVVSRELLNESGSVFVQIGDENVHLVRCLMDEVFGSENYLNLICFSTTSGFQSNELARAGDYLLWYAKNKESGVKYRQLFESLEKDLGKGGYRWVITAEGFMRGMTAKEVRGEEVLSPDLRSYKPDNILSQGASSQEQVFIWQGKTYRPNSNSHWKAQYPDGMNCLGKAGRIHTAANSIQYVRMADDFGLKARNNVWIDTLTGQYTDDKLYVVQTGTKVIERCILMTTDPGDIVLDPTCGSGTTAYVAEQWGRRWITMDTSRVALALARTRLMAAKYPYYLLADSSEGQKKEAEITAKPPSDDKTERDIRKGFVYKKVPHITLKAIANNAEIDFIHAKWQGKIDESREQFNKAVNKKCEEWEIPLNGEETWTSAAKKKHGEFLSLRRARQQEIDESINRSAEFETLYDQPFEDRKCVRVSGPFTVETMSPYRMLAPEERPRSEVTGQTQGDSGQFVSMILNHLKKAGVQNTFKQERMKFDQLELYAGEWLQAAGEYTDADGKRRRVAVTIGPETGTVGPDQVKEAAKEAIQGIGFDILLVCGFAFDPHVSEEAKRYGKLVILPTRINPDLLMGTELKNTGAGNLFMVFGEPDIEVTVNAEDKLLVSLRGLDIYDPITGEIRSSTTNEIACWFIDTNYNGECFNVRHAYFTGGDQPYDKLKKALRADIDEAAWETLYSDVSRPFIKPTTGKIAVKVINHYGDEVLKVYPVGKK